MHVLFLFIIEDAEEVVEVANDSCENETVPLPEVVVPAGLEVTSPKPAESPEAVRLRLFNFDNIFGRVRCIV